MQVRAARPSPRFQGSKFAEPLAAVLPLLVLIQLSIDLVVVWGLVFSYLRYYYNSGTG